MASDPPSKEPAEPAAEQAAPGGGAALQAYRAARREEREDWRSGRHATHGAGDGYFGAWRSTRVDAETETERERGTGRGRAFSRPGLPEDDALRRAPRPHFWSSRLYGEPHGRWESETAHPHPLSAADPAVVYEATGGAWSCCSCHASRPAGQMHHCATCWAARRKYDLCDRCWLQLRVDQSGGCSVARLEEFEWDLRDALQERQDHSARPFAILTRILGEGDQGLLLGGRATKTVAASNFRRLLCMHLFDAAGQRDAAPTEQEVQAVFAKYGKDDEGLLPYEVFARSLLSGVSAQLANRGFRRGPLRPGEPAEWPKQSMIRYPQCKRAVLPPSDWDGTLVTRSASKPEGSLELEHVFGYAGRQTVSPNLFYTRSGEVVYHTAALAVVADPPEEGAQSRQRFFRGHNNTITSLAAAPDGVTFATGQRVPTGSETRPAVLVWDSGQVDQYADGSASAVRLELGEEDGFVCTMAFSQADDGQFLATISGNEDHTIRLWDWRSVPPIMLSELPTKKGSPPQIYGVRWNPFPLQPDATLEERKKHVDLVVFGDNCLLSYSLNEDTQELERADPSAGACEMDVFRDACFLHTGHIITCGANGQLGVWFEGEGVQQIRNPHSAETEAFHEGGIRAIRAVRDPGGKVAQIITAGADGMVLLWESDSWDGFPTALADSKAPPPMTVGQQIPEEGPDEADGPGDRPSIVSVDAHPDHIPDEAPAKLLAGDAAGCIWELDSEENADSRLLMSGHGGDVMCVASHPREPAYCVSASTEGMLYARDIGSHQIGRRIRLPVDPEDEKGAELLRAWSCSFSTDGTMLAVSTAGVVGKGASETVDGLPYAMPPEEGGSVVVLDVRQVFGGPASAEAQYFCEQCQQDGPIVCSKCDKWCGNRLAIGASQPPRLFEIDNGPDIVEVARFSPDDSLLAVAGHGRVVDIYAVRPPDDGDESSNGPKWRRVARCIGHSGTVVQLDWSADGQILRSTSADYDVLHWDTRGRQVLNNQRDTAWADWTSTLGFEVMGIWAASHSGAHGMPDGATINAVHRSPCKRYVVTSDDNGAVRLLNYPCVVADAPAQICTGHASFVTGARWSADGQYVVTSGGHDGTLFQWKVSTPDVEDDAGVRGSWERRVGRSEFVPAAAYKGPRQGYAYREDGEHGAGYYHTPAEQRWQKQARANHTSTTLRQTRQRLRELTQPELCQLAQDANLTLDADDEDATSRAALIAMLLDHEASGMGRNGLEGEGSTLGMSTALQEASLKKSRLAQDLERFDRRVAAQGRQLAHRDVEIAALREQLSQVENIDRGKSRDRGLARRRVDSGANQTTVHGRGPLPTEGKIGHVRPIVALESHVANRMAELTFARGEELMLVRQSSAEWWLAKGRHGQKGLVPSALFAKGDETETA